MTEKSPNINTGLAAKLLKSTRVPRDKLPYTDEFDFLHRKYCGQTGIMVKKYDLMQTFFNLAKKGGYSGRRSERNAPDLTIEQKIFLGQNLGRRLPARAGLVYTKKFEALYDEFNTQFRIFLKRDEFWLAIDGLAKKVKGDEWKSQLQKACEAACLAVEVYNKPLVKFRCGGYIVLMNIAWTALMHAIFFRWGINPFYKKEGGSSQYQKRDGDYKAWELKTCLDYFYREETSAVRDNLNFFIGLRNKIEHRCLPALDINIFGECQAMLLNFEDMLFQQFGPEYGLTESLTLALQFSHLRDPEQAKAIRKLHEPLSSDIVEYIESFRSSLTEDVFNDLAYSYRVYLIPKVANRESASDVAVEFVKYNPEKSEEMEKYNQVVSLIKPVVSQVANQGRLRPVDICKAVLPIVQEIYGKETRFGSSYQHPAACWYYKIRPEKRSSDPTKTDVRFCQYDEAHRDYVFTEGWKKYLVQKMKQPDEYKKMMDAYRMHLQERK